MHWRHSLICFYSSSKETYFGAGICLSVLIFYSASCFDPGTLLSPSSLPNKASSVLIDCYMQVLSFRLTILFEAFLFFWSFIFQTYSVRTVRALYSRFLKDVLCKNAEMYHMSLLHCLHFKWFPALWLVTCHHYLALIGWFWDLFQKLIFEAMR